MKGVKINEAYSSIPVKKAWKFCCTIRGTYKSTYPFQTVKQRASHGLTVDEALEMANFIKEKNLFFQMVLDGITGCTWLAIKQWKLWFIFNRKAASKLRRGDGAQKAGLRFHRSANARWLRSEVTRSTLQLAQTSLLLRSTQQRSLPRLKRKQSKAETYEHSPTLLLFTALKFYLL